MAGQYFQNPNHSWFDVGLPVTRCHLAKSWNIEMLGEGPNIKKWVECVNAALAPSPFRGTIQFDIGGHRVTYYNISPFFLCYHLDLFRPATHSRCGRHGWPDNRFSVYG
ncbi:hypothetical protein CsSME_00025191 [Camellia sinensis var. sinensis]